MTSGPAIPTPPHPAPPAGSCDCHFHIFGPAADYPYRPGRDYSPPDALLGDYQSVLDRLGLDRCVLVQPSVYGTDNCRTLDALAALGPRARAVVAVDAGVSESDLERMHAAGARGVRFFLALHGATPIADLETVAAKIAPLGWHVQLLVDGTRLPDIAARLHGLPVPVVIDHMGYMPATVPADHPGRHALLTLLAEDRFWVKLSGAYRVSAVPFPHADAAPFARALMDAAPDRVVWGTDWPHPTFDGPPPDAGALLGLLADWTADPGQLRRTLCANPAALYGF